MESTLLIRNSSRPKILTIIATGDIRKKKMIPKIIGETTFPKHSPNNNQNLLNLANNE
jgi:hypothetical protein